MRDELGATAFITDLSANYIKWDYATIPEPSTLVLLGIGVALLAITRRRR